MLSTLRFALPAVLSVVTFKAATSGFEGADEVTTTPEQSQCGTRNGGYFVCHFRFIIQPMNIPVATPIVIPVAMPIENVVIHRLNGVPLQALDCVIHQLFGSVAALFCDATRRSVPSLKRICKGSCCLSPAALLRQFGRPSIPPLIAPLRIDPPVFKLPPCFCLVPHCLFAFT